MIPLFSCPNQSPNEEANTLSTQRAGAAFPLLAALRSSLLPWGQAALLVCRIRLHQFHHTKIWFAGKLRSRYPISLLTHKQQAFHLCKKKNKKTNLKNFKNNNRKRLNHANPANAFPKFSSVGVTGCHCCPWEVQPPYCSHPASLHPLQTLHSSCLAISLSRDCTKQKCIHSLK